MKTPCVYMMSNKQEGTPYIGVTSDLLKRGWQHKEKQAKGFTERYNLDKLVWFELHESMPSAIAAEKKLKNMPRAKKISIIERINPEWRDLYPELTGERSCATPMAFAG
jgi:putative endonuclease